MPYERERTCVNCGKTETVRKDNKAKRCRSCASSVKGRIVGEKRKAQAHRPPCKHCGENVKTCRAQFCSMACKSGYSRMQRTCKQCGGVFSVLRSALKTNASGNFCSRDCYNRFLCRTDRITGRGSQWKKKRDEAIEMFPFCAVCGTRKKLQVHHIIPFRLTRDNSLKNLIPLCVKHHRWVETMFVETEAHGGDIGTLAMFWKNILRSRQQTTLSELRRIHARA